MLEFLIHFFLLKLFCSIGICHACTEFSGTASKSLIIKDANLQGSSCHQHWRGKWNDDVDLDSDDDSSVSMCWTPGAVLGSVLHIIKLKPYHTLTIWVLLPFLFTDGKTEAQKVVQGHSDSKR